MKLASLQWLAGLLIAAQLFVGDAANGDGISGQSGGLNTATNPGAKFFVTFTRADMSKGPPTATPQQIEASRNAPESRPADADPEGHWGDIAGGFQLSARFEKQTFRLGEPVVATVIIRNVAEQIGHYRDWVGLHEDAGVCQFEILDEQKKIVTRTDPRAPADITDGPHIPRALKPGSQCRYEVKLSEKFKLDRPGTYIVRAHRWVHKLQGDGYVEIKSAPATITITKAAEAQKSPGTGARADAAN